VAAALRQLREAVGGAGLGAVFPAPLGRVFAAGLAVVVIGAIAWAAFVRGGGTSPPPELTMPRADTGVSSTTSSGRTVRPPPDGSPAGSPASSSSLVFVHVAGAVVRPGLYRLGGAPRVADAIDAAGGVAPTADLDAVNLAATVTDGERVYVPRLGEVPPPAAAAGASNGTLPGPIDLNTATAEQLDALPGVGPSTAQAIVSYRQEHGRFRSVDELLEVRGIGPSKLEDLRAKVRVR
jgi:competence protein ComEA